MRHVLLLAGLCALAFACTNNDEDSNNEEEQITIPTPIFVDITFNGTTADVSIPERAVGLTCTSGSNTDVVLTLDESITTEYYYRVKGASTSGSLTINSPYKLTLLLAGLDLTSTGTEPAIHINSGKRVALILQEKTVNTLCDNVLNEKKGTFYTKGHLEIQGGGVLNITGKVRHALAAKEYLQIKKSTGYINILGAAGDGIHCGKADGDPENNYFKINGGTLTFSNVEGDLIDCDDYGTAYINGGTLNLDVTNYDAKGLKADSLIYMTGGTINLNVAGDESCGIQSNYAAYFSGGNITGTVSGYNSNGIKGNNLKTTTTVFNGGYLYFSGTNISLSLPGTLAIGINAEKTIEATDGTVSLQGLGINEPGYKAKKGITTSGSAIFKWETVE